MIVLDTHALVFWVQQPRLLGRRARGSIAEAEEIGVPSIVWWEIALLVRKGRLALSSGLTPAAWTAEVLSIPRVRSLDLSPAIAVAADALPMHPDPADRFIVATALHYETAVVTRDELIRQSRTVPTVW